MTSLAPRKPEPTPVANGRPTLARQLQDALADGDIDSARLLIALGAPISGDPARRIPPALATAVQAKALEQEFVHKIIRATEDVNGYEDEPDGNTLLHLAVMHRPEVVPILLEKGADPNRTNKKGETPLLMAVRAGDLHSMQTLLAWSADPHLKAEGAPSAFDMARRQALTHPRGGDVLDYIEQTMERRQRELPPENPTPSVVEGLLDQLPATTMAERLARRRVAAGNEPVHYPDSRQRRHIA